MEVPREREVLFYAKTRGIICQINPLPAAMVFEETASHKPLSSATWTDRSALVPKAPAPFWLS